MSTAISIFSCLMVSSVSVHARARRRPACRRRSRRQGPRVWRRRVFMGLVSPVEIPRWYQRGHQRPLETNCCNSAVTAANCRRLFPDDALAPRTESGRPPAGEGHFVRHQHHRHAILGERFDDTQHLAGQLGHSRRRPLRRTASASSFMASECAMAVCRRCCRRTVVPGSNGRSAGPLFPASACPLSASWRATPLILRGARVTFCSTVRCGKGCSSKTMPTSWRKASRSTPPLHGAATRAVRRPGCLPGH